MNSKKELLKNKITIDNKEYYYLADFAELTNRSHQAVRLAIEPGNRLAKLKATKVGESLLIIATELTRFPFCCPGKSKRVIFFTEEAEEYTQIIANKEQWESIKDENN